MKGYIDIHCHVLPGLDDGADTMEAAAEMLSRAYACGITTVIATPHFGKGFGYATPAQVRRLTAQVQETAHSIHPSMRVLPGEELMFQFQLLEQIDRGEIVGLAGSHYVLVEFSPNLDYTAIRTAVQEIRARGFRPVIAHMERYPCFYGRLHLVRRLIASGAYIQVNSSSFQRGWFRRDFHFARELLEGQLIDFIGTDGHDVCRRPPVLDDFLAYACRKNRESEAERLLIRNPDRVIRDEPIRTEEYTYDRTESV